MALVSEAEVDETRGTARVRAVSVTQPISGTGPSLKECSQKAGVVAAPAAELPDKIGPEASNIANEVFPAASAVCENILKGRSHAVLQGDLTKLCDTVGVKGSASSTTVPQKLTDKSSLVKSMKGDADKSNKSVPCPDLSGQQKLRSSLEKLQSDKSSTRGIEKPAVATAPQVADGEMKPSMSARKQPRASIASNKSRMSVDQMLFLNKQLPSDSEQGVLQSDVNVVVAIEPQPAAAQQMAEGALMKEQPKGQQAQPEPEEPQPQVKQQPLRGEMGAVGGPERSAEVGPVSPGKIAKGGSSKRNKAERRRLRLLAKEQAGKQRKLAPLVPYKPSMGLLSVESDSEYMRMPKVSGATVKQGKQGDAQKEIPELQEPMRNNVGQEDASSSRNSSKSAESVMKVAIAQHAAPGVYKVEGKTSRTKGSGKKTSLSASNVRLPEESAAVKRPRGIPGTMTSLQEQDHGAKKDAATAGRDLPEPVVVEAELRGDVLEPAQQVPLRKEGSQANVAALNPDDKRQKEGKRKSHKKSRKRQHKKVTG